VARKSAGCATTAGKSLCLRCRGKKNRCEDPVPVLLHLEISYLMMARQNKTLPYC
jgi:hypothetical protein